MKDRSFYNTIELYGKELRQAEKNALSQEQKIMRHFLMRGTQYEKSPNGIRRLCFDSNVPLTSVRRAMTNLTKCGDLVKLPAVVTGPYGKPEHLWTASAKWTRAQPRQGELL
jgi:hypothetical protein